MANSPTSANLPKGKEVPRIWTQPLRPLTPRTSLGFECIQFAADVLGWQLFPWQRWWLIHALEVVGRIDDRQLRFKTVLTLVGRQCGKTTLLKLVALWMMYTGMVRLVLGAAQSLDIAREAWAGAVEIVEGDPELAAEVAPNGVRRANGEQCLTLHNGSRYRITAATRSAGRGLSVDLLILDELREHRDFQAWSALSNTTRARPNGLIVAISNAGDDFSAVLNQLRDAAIAGTEMTTGIFEWSAPDTADIDDWEAIAQGLPGLGYSWSHESVVGARAMDPVTVFRTEIMCQRVESLDTPVSPLAWKACGDPAGTSMRGAEIKHLCLDVAPDGEHATLAVATIGADDKVRVGVAAAWHDLGSLRSDLGPLLAELRPKTLGWFPNGPAAALAADMLTVRHTKRVPFTAADALAACQGFAEQTASRMLVHGNDPLLTSHVLGSRRLPSGDGWRFARRDGHADAAYAAAGAVHLARISPRPQRLKLYVANTG